MTNNQVVKAFENGIQARSLNMTSTGNKLFSYNTVIAQWTAYGIVKNATKYSRTTSKQVSHLNYDLLTRDTSIPRNTQDLLDYEVHYPQR